MFSTLAGVHSRDSWSRREIKRLELWDDAETAMRGQYALYITTLRNLEADREVLAVIEQAINRLSKLGLTVELGNGDPAHLDPGIATWLVASNLAARGVTWTRPGNESWAQR